MAANLMTVGDVAREIGEPRPRVQYAIEKIGLTPRCRAGILRLFSRDQIPAIVAALGTIRQANRVEASCNP